LLEYEVLETNKTVTPTTLIEAIRYFSNPDICLKFMVAMRWPNGIIQCPQCGSEQVTFLRNARLWKCRANHPRQKFSVKVGTIFEDSPIGLDKWLAAIWMIANCKNGVSSYEIHREIGVTQKTAWFMLHRIRLAMQTGTFKKLAKSNPMKLISAALLAICTSTNAQRRSRVVDRW
jgi:transposase-like protein